MLLAHSCTQVPWLSQPQPPASGWILHETNVSTCIWQPRYLSTSTVCTLSVPMLLAHTWTQHPPHAYAPHDHMHSGTLVSWVSDQAYSFLLSDDHQDQVYCMFTHVTQCMWGVLDPPVSALSLSLYRHPFLYTLFSSRFTLIINNRKNST